MLNKPRVPVSLQHLDIDALVIYVLSKISLLSSVYCFDRFKTTLGDGVSEKGLLSLPSFGPIFRNTSGS